MTIVQINTKNAKPMYKCDLLWEKGPLGIFYKIEFLAWIDSSMYVESNGASFMKNYFTSRVMTIFMHSGRYIRFSENAHF